MDQFAKDLKELNRIKAEQGEEAFQAAVREYAEKVLASGSAETVSGMAGTLLRDIQEQQATYEAEARERAKQQDQKAEQQRNLKPSEFEGDQGFLRVIQQSVPAMQSQAQFNAFMASFDALRGLMNSIFSGNEKSTLEFKEAFEKTLVVAKQVTEVTTKLQDVPEAAESKLADEFKQPPRQFTEYDVQRGLLAELQAIQSLEVLTRWWVANRQKIDEVRSPMLRNPLIDAVRAKKEELS